MCDCSEAIASVSMSNVYAIGANLYRRITSLCKQLCDLNVKCCLAWIPSHTGIIGNEMADDLARSLAYDVFMKRVDAPMYISLSTAFNMLNVIAIDSWQRKWEYEPTGHFTRQLIPSVGSKIVFPDSRDVGISYCRLLLHDTLLQDDSYHTGTSDTPLCSRGKDRETSGHFLLSCSKYNNQRTVMLHSIYDICSSVKHKGTIEVSENLILGHNGTHNYERRTTKR